MKTSQHIIDENSILNDKYSRRVKFSVVDALNLPLPNESVDLVYGYAFVHHLENLSKFFSEIQRVLKKEGEGIFMDDAYSPFWHFVKSTLLKPLQQYSHRRHGISPEDLRATKEGGFKRKVLAKWLDKYNLELITFL